MTAYTLTLPDFEKTLELAPQPRLKVAETFQDIYPELRDIETDELAKHIFSSKHFPNE